MRLRNSLGFLVLLVGVGILPVRAQDDVVLLVETNLPDAVVYADSMALGPAARGAFVVPASVRTLRLVPAGGDAWAIEPVTAALDAAPGDTLALDLPFPYHYKIESIPFGATVYRQTLDGRVGLGETPVQYQASSPLSQPLLVEKRGYVPAEIQPGNNVWNRYVLTLEPVRPQQEQTAEMDWKPPGKPRRWIDYTAAAVALGAGVLAVHYKFKADDIDDRYRQTGDEALRDRVESFDTRSAVALGVMQVSIGVLAIRFVLR